MVAKKSEGAAGIDEAALERAILDFEGDLLEKRATAVERSYSAFERIAADAAAIRLLEKSGPPERPVNEVLSDWVDKSLGSGFDPESKAQKKSSIYRQYLTNRVDLLNQAKNRLRKDIEEGGGAKMLGSVTLTPEQEKLAKRGREWYMTPEQTMFRLIREGGLSKDEIADLMVYSQDPSWKANPKLKEKYLAKFSEPQRGVPDIRGDEPSAVGKAFDYGIGALGIGGSLVSGAKEEVLTPLLRATRDVPYEKPEKPFFDLSEHPALQKIATAAKGGVADVPGTLLDAAIVSSPVVGPVAAATGFKGVGKVEVDPVEFVAQTPADINPLPTPDKIINPVLDLIQGKQVRVGGVPVKEAARAMTPRLASKIGEGLWHAGRTAFDPYARGQTIRENVSLATDKMVAEAKRMATEEAPGAPVEERAARARQLYRQMKAADYDPAGFDPAIRQVAQETLADPFNVVPAAHPLTLASKGGKKLVAEGVGLGADALRAMKDTGKAQRIREGIYGVAGGVTHSPEAVAFDLAAERAASPEQAEKLRQAARVQRVARDVGQTKDLELDEMRRLLKQMPAEGSAESGQAMTAALEKMTYGEHVGPRIAESSEPVLGATPLTKGEFARSLQAGGGKTARVPPLGPRRPTQPTQFERDVEMNRQRIARDLGIQEEFADEAARLQEKYGFRRKIDEGGLLIETPRKQDYVSTQLREGRPEDAEVDQLMGYAQSRHITARWGEASEAFSKKDPWGALKDIRAQGEHVVREMERRIPAYAEIDVLDKGMAEIGMSADIPRPRLMEVSQKARAAKRGVDIMSRRVEKLNEARLSAIKRSDLAFEVASDQEAGIRALVREGDPVWVEDRLFKTLAKRNYSSRKHLVEDLAQEQGRAAMKLQQAQKALAELSEEVAKESKNFESMKPELDRLTKEWGIEAVPLGLGDALEAAAVKKGIEPPGKIYALATGIPGQTNIASTIKVVPRPVAMRAHALTVSGAATESGFVESYRNLVRGLLGPELGATFAHPVKGIVRPANRLWRMSKTLVAPNYYLMNAAGAFTLSTVAHGVKALDPKLQAGAFGMAVMSGGLFDEEVRGTKFMLRSGVESTFGEIVDSAKKMGAIDTYEMRLGLGMRGVGILDNAVKVVEDAAFKLRPPGALGDKLNLSKLSPANANRIIDNYQKLVVFAGFLDDPKGLSSVIRAADATAEFAGNYGRMGTLEKALFRDTLGFYSWYRFIFPHVLRQSFAHPVRMAQWDRIRTWMQNTYGDQVAVWGEALSSQAREFGFVAPPGVQPEEGTKDPVLGTDRFAMLVLEDPIQMGFSIMRQIARPAGLDEDQGPAQLAGPFTKMLTEAMTGFSLDTGQPIPELADLGEGEAGLWNAMGQKSEWSKKTAAGRFAWGFVERPSRMYTNIANLYRNHGLMSKTGELMLRYKAGQDLAGLDHAAAQVLNGVSYSARQAGFDVGDAFQPLTKGGFFETGIPSRLRFEDIPLNLWYSQQRAAKAKEGY